VLAGVYDVKLRTGNNSKREAVFGVGLLGMDLTLEGPIKKGYGGSYLVNYRYSTAGLASDLGLLGDIGGVLSFQDAAFKVSKTRNVGDSRQCISAARDHRRLSKGCKPI